MIDEQATRGPALPGPSPRAQAAAMRAPLRPWQAVLAAIVSGLALSMAFQPFDWWPLAIPAVALALLAIRGRSVAGAAGIGALAAASMYVVHIWWITVYLGPVPLIGLVLLMSAWQALGAVLLRFAWRLAEPGGPLARPVLAVAVLPVLLAGIWMARESLASAVPWGGFPWGRLAHTQASSPIGDAIGWVGMPGLTFLLALVAALLAVLALTSALRPVVRVATAAAAIAGLVAIPGFPIEQTGTMRIGAVQGASEAGLLAQGERWQIVREHAAATQLLAGEQMDLLVWPENAGEFDPMSDPLIAPLIDSIQQEAGAPMILGAVTTEGDDVYNSLLLLQDGEVLQTYHKRNPVPFAEYLPERALLAPVLDALGFLDLIPRDFSIDPTSRNVFDVSGVQAGLAICYDIVSDDLSREMVLDGGAEIVLSPSNNADFGEGSWQNVQQLAIARLRAMEAGRAVVTISTVGTSGIALPDGSLLATLPQYEPGAMIETLPLSSTVTSGIALGRPIELALGALGVGGTLLLGLAWRWRRARSR